MYPLRPHDTNDWYKECIRLMKPVEQCYTFKYHPAPAEAGAAPPNT